MTIDAIDFESRDGRRGVFFVATVHKLDHVCFTAACATRRELVARIAEYVDTRADENLWAEDACEVRLLLENGALERAIERYFARVGERWDDEWLVTAKIDTTGTPDASALLDRVVPRRASGDAWPALTS